MIFNNSDSYDARIKRSMRLDLRIFMRDNPGAVFTIDEDSGVTILRVPVPGSGFDRMSIAYRSAKDAQCAVTAKWTAVTRFGEGQTVLVPSKSDVIITGWHDAMAPATKF